LTALKNQENKRVLKTENATDRTELSKNWKPAKSLLQL